MKTTMTHTVVMILAILFTHPSQADIYKCLGDPLTDPDGIYYQDEPCSDHAVQHELKAYTAIPAPDMVADAQRKKRLDVLHLRQRIREEQRVLDRLHVEMDQQLASLQDQPSTSLAEAEDRFDQDAFGFTVSQWQDALNEDNSNDFDLVKTRCQNKIDRQQKVVDRLHRKLEKAEKRLAL